MAVATKEHKHREKIQKASVRTQLSVDFPRQGETIASDAYTFRISAPGDVQKVEVAIDQAEWRPCRQSAGYWWSDWSGYENGEHEITARLVTAEGRAISAEPHEFFVRLEKVPV
ncbi:MAG: hypothetical protein ACHQ49_15855 [Elusimicrobiota bacterium]